MIDYKTVQRQARKSYRRALSSGEPPYVPVLDNILSDSEIYGEEYLGRMEIPVHMIVGTKTTDRMSAFSCNFLPLLDYGTEFSTKWIHLYNEQIENGFTDPVKLYEYKNKFYVLEGNKRVSIMKYLNGDSVMAQVTRIIPEKNRSLESCIYYEFMEFFKVTSFYGIEFSKPGCYAELADLFGQNLETRWPEEALTLLKNSYIFFGVTLSDMNIENMEITPGDAFLIYLKKYGVSELMSSSYEKLRESIEQLKTEYQGMRKRILIIADHPDDTLWSEQVKMKARGVDMIISCGDLEKSYLEYIVTLTNVPLLYVPGNHDTTIGDEPPEGCINIDGKVVSIDGLNIAGLGGCMKYKSGPHQYTEGEMRERVRGLSLKLLINTVMRKNLDILVTHSPAAGYGDLDDLAHQGFECFNWLLNRFKPKYMLHGHVHTEYVAKLRNMHVHESGTTVINGSGNMIIDYV